MRSVRVAERRERAGARTAALAGVLALAAEPGQAWAFAPTGDCRALVTTAHELEELRLLSDLLIDDDKDGEVSQDELLGASGVLEAELDRLCILEPEDLWYWTHDHDPDQVVEQLASGVFASTDSVSSAGAHAKAAYDKGLFAYTFFALRSEPSTAWEASATLDAVTEDWLAYSADRGAAFRDEPLFMRAMEGRRREALWLDRPMGPMLDSLSEHERRALWTGLLLQFHLERRLVKDSADLLQLRQAAGETDDGTLFAVVGLHLLAASGSRDYRPAIVGGRLLLQTRTHLGTVYLDMAQGFTPPDHFDRLAHQEGSSPVVDADLEAWQALALAYIDPDGETPLVRARDAATICPTCVHTQREHERAAVAAGRPWEARGALQQSLYLRPGMPLSGFDQRVMQAKRPSGPGEHRSMARGEQPGSEGADAVFRWLLLLHLVAWVPSVAVAGYIGWRRKSTVIGAGLGFLFGILGVVAAFWIKDRTPRCPRCSVEVREDARRCPRCDADLTRRPAQVPPRLIATPAERQLLKKWNTATGVLVFGPIVVWANLRDKLPPSLVTTYTGVGLLTSLIGLALLAVRPRFEDRILFQWGKPLCPGCTGPLAPEARKCLRCGFDVVGRKTPAARTEVSSDPVAPLAPTVPGSSPVPGNVVPAVASVPSGSVRWPCPRCSAGLSRRSTPAGFVNYCSTCEGQYISVTTLRMRAEDGPELVAEVLRRARRQGRPGVTCPHCHLPMRATNAVVAEQAVEIDVCLSCQGIWFDRGEHAQVGSDARPAPAEARPPSARHDDNALPSSPLMLAPALLGLPVELDDTPLQATPIVTRAVVLLCALVFVGQLSMGLGPSVTAFAYLPSEPARLGGAPLVASFFMHGGWLHLLGNSYFLWVFGDNVEDRLGRFAFVGLLALGHVAGAAVHTALDLDGTVPVVGASAGIAAVIAAYAVLLPRARLLILLRLIPVRLPAWTLIILYVLLQVAGGVLQVTGGSSVSYLAHLGGLAVGGVWALVHSLRGDR